MHIFFGCLRNKKIKKISSIIILFFNRFFDHKGLMNPESIINKDLVFLMQDESLLFGFCCEYNKFERYSLKLS